MDIPAAMKALDPGSPFRVTNDSVKYWFRILNHEIWQDALPMFDTIQIRPFVKNWAMCIEDTDKPQTKYRLAINIEFPTFDLFVNVLAHEMIHLYQFINCQDGEHDESFWVWQFKFIEHGLKLEQAYGY